jgi:NADPH:quinone reductase-like Zn-dependent oxidoreductase
MHRRNRILPFCRRASERREDACLAGRASLPRANLGNPGQGAAAGLEDLLFVKRLVESGEFRPVIDRRYPLEEVIEASRYVETERKKGNVILTVLPTTSA